ncbi:MAG: hypothetical protein ABH865_00815 [Candidatus Omnitrophota bacterium]
MKNYKVSEGLAIFIAIAGSLVMLGWIFNIGILKSILPVWVTMKATTALSFILSGITVYFIAKSQQKSSGATLVILPISTMLLLLLMVTHLSATCLGLSLGLDGLFVKESNGVVMSVAPGRPSLATMIEFILIAVAGVLTMLNPAKLKAWLVFLGWVVMFIGSMAVIGYIFRIPVLYYYIEGVSTAMACHTSILFVLSGLSLVFSGIKKQVVSQVRDD